MKQENSTFSNMAETNFTIKGDVEIYYEGKVFRHHNSLSNSAKEVIAHCLAGDDDYKLNGIIMLYSLDDDPQGMTRTSMSYITQRSYQNNNTELKLSALFNLEYGPNSTSATIKFLDLGARQKDVYTPGTPQRIIFSTCDLSSENPPLTTTAKQLSINWIIKPQ